MFLLIVWLDRWGLSEYKFTSSINYQALIFFFHNLYELSHSVQKNVLEFDDVLCLYTVYDKKILQKTHCFRGLLYSRIKTISNINSNVIAVNYQDDDRIIWCKYPFVNRKIKNTKKKKCLMVPSPQPKKPFPTRLWNVWSLSDFSHKCSLFKCNLRFWSWVYGHHHFQLLGFFKWYLLCIVGHHPTFLLIENGSFFI